MNTRTTTAQPRFLPAILLACGAASSALANPAGIEVVALTGTPTANGVMSSFYLQPSIGDAGHIMFHAYLTGTTLGERNAYAEFRASPDSPASVAEISRKSDPLPDGNGIMEAPYLSSVNPSGLMAGACFFTGTNAGEDDDFGVMFSNGGAVVHVARQGSPMPDNDGHYDQFDAVHVDDFGRVTFWADTGDAQSGWETGIFRSTGGVVSTLFRSGDPAPGGVGTLDYISSSIDIKAGGTIAFCASLDNAGDSLHDDRVYRNINGVTVTIAREGDLSPDGNGQLWQNWGNFIAAARASLNGYVAFRCDLLGTAGGDSDNAAVFRGNGGPLTMIAREGQPAPDGNGLFSKLYIPDVTDSGAVVFETDFSNTSGGDNDSRALVSGSGGPVTIIVREGQPTPSGDGQFDGAFLHWNCNAAGDIAIRTDLRNTQAGGLYENGIFFYRPGQQLIEVIRNGSPFLGSTVTLLNTTDQSYAPSLSPINASGQIAFYFQLADGREGIARFTPPPACLGDFNADGVRDTADLVVFLGKFGQAVAPWSVGDLNGDGLVNTPDLTIFLGVFGRPCR